MATYRPNWKIEKWLLVSKHLKNSLEHLDESQCTEEEIEFIANIIQDLEGREPINNLVSAIMSKSDLVEPPSVGGLSKENQEAFDAYLKKIGVELSAD